MGFRLGAFESAHDTFVIAEAGINHDGDLDQAKRLATAAKAAGADAVKYQVFTTRDFLSRHVVAPPHFGGSEGFFAYLESLELSRDEHRELAAHCQQIGIPFFATPLDAGAVTLLDALDVPLYKIASCDLDNTPLLRQVAATGRPMIVSSGMGTLDEVAAALEACRAAGARELAALHCVSQYPPRPEETNLKAIPAMQKALGVPIGFSDHSIGPTMAVAAVALGARIVEKHVTLDRSADGADHAVSMEPDDLQALINAIRDVEAGLGDGVKAPTPAEEEMKAAFRRSLVAARALEAGTVLSPADLVPKRPGTGISPGRIDDLVGRRLVRDVAADDLLGPEDLD